MQQDSTDSTQPLPLPQVARERTVTLYPLCRWKSPSIDSLPVRILRWAKCKVTKRYQHVKIKIHLSDRRILETDSFIDDDIDGFPDVLDEYEQRECIELCGHIGMRLRLSFLGHVRGVRIIMGTFEMAIIGPSADQICAAVLPLVRYFPGKPGSRIEKRNSVFDEEPYETMRPW